MPISEQEHKIPDHLNRMAQMMWVLNDSQPHVREALQKLNDSFSALEKSVEQVCQSERVQLDALDEVEKKYSKAVWTTLYMNAIDTFISTMKISYDFGVIDEDDYAPMREMIDKWKNRVEIGREFYDSDHEEFMCGLDDISHNHPQLIEGGHALRDVYRVAFWDHYFEWMYDRIVTLTEKFETAAGRFRKAVDIEAVLVMSPFMVEELVACLFRAMGYEADTTSKTRDYGVDVVARKDGSVVAVQVKRYAEGNNIGNRDVQRLLGAMQFREIKANAAVLITTSDFTAAAHEQARETPAELWNGEYFGKLLSKYGRLVTEDLFG